MFDEATPVGYESITIAGTAVGFTVATLSNANKVFITCETAQVRFNCDGSTPTASEGHILNAGESLEITGHQKVRAFLAIRTGATSGVLKCTYSRTA